MSAQFTGSVTLSTPFGPAGFQVTISNLGEVLEVASSTSQLPETVFRLTYGDKWEAARAYFLDLKDNLPFQVEAALVLPAPPAPFLALRQGFQQLSATAPAEMPSPAPVFRQRAQYWATVPAYLDLLFLVPGRMTRALQQMANDLQQTKGRKVRRLAFLEPWMFSLINLLDSDQQKRLYQMMGALRTPTVGDYLFSELERAGRHIAAEGLLLGVMHYQDAANTARIVALYPSLRDDPELVQTYLRVLEKLRGENIRELALEILADHPFQAAAVLRILRKNNHPHPVTAIRQQFDREEDEWALDSLLGVINGATAGAGVSLAEMNARIDDPVFLAVNPIAWPQQLHDNWLQLVKNSSEEAVMDVVTTYLSRSEPLLQRNALLQLRILAKRPAATWQLPLAVETALRALINHRVDKIYTVAIDLAALLMPRLQEPELMVDALLAHAPLSRYRLMDAAALRQAAQRPDLRQRQLDYLHAAIGTAADAAGLEALARFLPYVNFLKAEETLKAAVAAREKALSEVQ